MKKIKLLIPALAVASVATAVTPFVTSCNKGASGLLSAETSKKGSWVTKYDYKYESLDKARYIDQIALAKAYASKINSNPAAFSDDYIGSYINYVSVSGEEESAPRSETLTISNAHIVNKWITCIQVEETDTYITASLISFDMNIHRVVNESENENNGIWDINYHFQDMPYVMAFGEEELYDEMPYFTPAIALLDSGELASALATYAILASKCYVDLDYTVKDLKEVYYLSQADLTFDSLGLLYMFMVSNEANVDPQKALTLMAEQMLMPIACHYFAKAVQGKE